MRARDKHKGSDRDTANKTLSDQDKTLFITKDDTDLYVLNIRNQTVRITNNASFTLVLPSVAEARNLSFDIKIDTNGNVVTLTDWPNASYNDSVSWGGDYTLDTVDDQIILKSNGQLWSVTTNNIA